MHEAFIHGIINAPVGLAYNTIDGRAVAIHNVHGAIRAFAVNDDVFQLIVPLPDDAF